MNKFPLGEADGPPQERESTSLSKECLPSEAAAARRRDLRNVNGGSITKRLRKNALP